MSKAILTKIGKVWLVIVQNGNGTTSDYRFPSKDAALKWAQNAGVKL